MAHCYLHGFGRTDRISSTQFLKRIGEIKQLDKKYIEKMHISGYPVEYRIRSWSDRGRWEDCVSDYCLDGNFNWITYNFRLKSLTKYDMGVT